MKKKKKEIKEYLLIIIFGILINAFCILLYSCTVHAASTNSNLPYYINRYNSTYNSFLEDNNINVNDIVTGAINGINGNHAYFGSPDTSKCLVFLSDYSSGFNRVYFWLLFNPRYEGTFNETSYNNFNYDTLQLKCDVAVYRVTFSTQTFTSTEMKKQSGSSFNMFGSLNTVTTNFGTYTPNYPCGMVGLDELKDNSGNGAFVIVSNSTPSIPIGTGHATAPDSFEDPTLATGSNHTLPHEVPESPTINNYTWITYNPPAIDTSTIESLLESLIYVINYLAGWFRDNLAGEFQNLISNITGLIEYIGETIQYYGGLIISNIQNGIETFYNNMVSLFEPIAATINYISEPISGTIIYDNISGTSLVSNITSINTALTSFQTSFENLSEPSSFTIPIHLENLPVAYFGNQTTQYIDLGIIGSTEKGLIRTFMWALVTYSLFITIVDSVSNYINGGGDES